MKEKVAWEIERQLWTGGAMAYRKLVDPRCVMAFPPPGGVMPFDVVIASIERMPRWLSVEMTDRIVTRPAQDVTVLAYKAEGRRAGEKPYEAFCTSTYCRFGEDWRLVQHQQSPA